MPENSTPVEAWHDPIVAEVREARETLFAEANYDIYEFCRRLSDRQAHSGHSVVKRSSVSLENSRADAADPSSGSRAG
jgi:hypothetical protein